MNIKKELLEDKEFIDELREELGLEEVEKRLSKIRHKVIYDFKRFKQHIGALERALINRSEELKEISWAVGFEYLFEQTFALRTGYFSESKEKGYRRYFTLGAGFDVNIIDIDVSYLFSTSSVRNPLENTLRFSLTFNL